MGKREEVGGGGLGESNALDFFFGLLHVQNFLLFNLCAAPVYQLLCDLVCTNFFFFVDIYKMHSKSVY